MKNNYLYKLFILACCLILVTVKNASAQARYGVGFSYGFNKPLVSDYSNSYGWKVIGNIPLTSKFSLSPYAGYENLKGNLRLNTSPGLDGSYYSGRIENIDLANIGIDAKYNFNTYLFIKGGALAYMATGGGEDFINPGVGFSGSAGFALPVTKFLRFEFTGYANAVYIQPASGHGITPYIGVTGAIFFDFGNPISSIRTGKSKM
jgi:hypothetical protein